MKRVAVTGSSDPTHNPMGPPDPPKFWYAQRWAAQNDAFGFPHSESLQAMLNEGGS